MNTCLNQPIEPFIVPAKVLRAGMGIPPDVKNRQAKTLDYYIRIAEVLLVALPFTVVTAPFVLLGLVYGVLFLAARIGFVILPLAIGGAFGLIGLWSLLLRSDATLIENEGIRSSAKACAALGLVTDAALALFAANSQAGWYLVMLLAPAMVTIHRWVRLEGLRQSAARALPPKVQAS